MNLNTLNCAKGLPPTTDKKLKFFKSILEGLSEDYFDEDGELTYEFLSKFTYEDMAPLVEARERNEVPTWTLWAQKYPQHSEVEWATVWTFCKLGLNDPKKWRLDPENDDPGNTLAEQEEIRMTSRAKKFGPSVRLSLNS